jgi:hypothetical protein
MPLSKENFLIIKEMISDVVKTSEEKTEERVNALITKLQSLTPDELNGHLLFGVGEGKKYQNIAEAMIMEYLKAVENEQSSAISSLLRLMNVLFSLPGFDINAKNPGQLHGAGRSFGLLHLVVSQRALENKHISHIQQLLDLFYKQEADFNILNKERETALHIVVTRHRNAGHANRLIRLLDVYGCGLNRVNLEDRTAYDLVGNQKLPLFYNDSIARYIAELGGITARESNPLGRNEHDGHRYVRNGQVIELAKLCNTGANLNIENGAGLSVVEALLASPEAKDFLSNQVIKVAIQSQCPAKLIYQCHKIKPSSYEVKEVAAERESHAHSKDSFLAKLKSIHEKKNSVEGVNKKEEKWIENMIMLCQKPSINMSFFVVLMKSAGKNIMEKALSKIEAHPESQKIYDRLQHYCNEASKKDPSLQGKLPNALLPAEKQDLDSQLGGMAMSCAIV